MVSIPFDPIALTVHPVQRIATIARMCSNIPVSLIGASSIGPKSYIVDALPIYEIRLREELPDMSPQITALHYGLWHLQVANTADECVGYIWTRILPKRKTRIEASGGRSFALSVSRASSILDKRISKDDVSNIPILVYVEELQMYLMRTIQSSESRWRLVRRAVWSGPRKGSVGYDNYCLLVKRRILSDQQLLSMLSIELT